MVQFLLSLFISGLLNVTGIPNHYPTYMTAREVSKKEQKELLIFFTSETCTRCIEAWAGFENDKPATTQYISTIINTKDFDGNTLFEMYEMKNTPAWVIITPDGLVTDSWEGGWKNALLLSGTSKTTANETEVTKTTSVSMQPNSHVEEKAPRSSSTSNELAGSIKNSSSKPAIPEPTEAKQSTTPLSAASIGFIIQAGYFGSQPNANKLIADLKSGGFDHFVIREEQKDGSTYYRIISKTYTTESDASKELGNISGMGIKATIRKSNEI